MAPLLFLCFLATGLPLLSLAAPESAPAAPAHAAASHHWEYEAQGEDWPGFEGDASQCGSSVRQSPIDIEDDLARDSFRRVHLGWELDGPLALQNNGHSLMVSVPGTPGQRGFLRFRREDYELAQFHFHAPSEHTFEGDERDAEVHFVHKRTTTSSGRGDNGTAAVEYAVVAVTFAVDHDLRAEERANAFLKALLDAHGERLAAGGNTTTVTFPPGAGLSSPPSDDARGNRTSNLLSSARGAVPPPLFRRAGMPLNHLLPLLGMPLEAAAEAETDGEDPPVDLPPLSPEEARALDSWREFYHYRGSLTTPPCTESVLWFVQKRAVRVPLRQVEAMQRLFMYTGSEGNWRETQNEHNDQQLYLVKLE